VGLLATKSGPKILKHIVCNILSLEYPWRPDFLFMAESKAIIKWPNDELVGLEKVSTHPDAIV
jgi:biotin-(acetyl-CoA carboxylase) ligase